MTSGGGFGGDADTLFVDVITRLDEKSTRQVEQEIEQAGDAAGKKGGGALSNAFGGMLGSLPVMAGAAAAAVGAAVVGGVVAVANMAAEAQQNVAEFQAQLGVTADEAGRLGAVAEQVFGDNWTGSLTEAAAAVTNVRREIKDLSEKDLRQVTGATVAIAETFEEEQQRVAAAVQSVMQATGVSAQEATDFIARGFQKGLNSSGDFLDTLTEYAPQFEKAKIGGGELFSLLETGAAKGALGTDKIADAFKEFGLTIVDVSDDSKGIYEELNLNQEKLVKGINDGSITQAQAFETVTNALAKVKGQADRTRIGAAIFGGAGEDFANGLTQLDLTKTSMKDLEGGVDSVNTRYNSFRDVFQGVWRQVQVALLPVGKELLGIANEAMPAVKSALAQVTPVVTTVVRFLIDGFRQGRQVAGQFAGEFGPQIERALVTFRPVLQAIGPLFASTFGLIKTLWENVLRPVLTAIAPLIVGTVASIGNTLNVIVRIVTGVVNTVTALLKGDLSGAVKAMQGIFEDGVTYVVRQMRNMGSTILGLIKNIAPQMAGAAGDIIRGLIRGIENGAGAAVDAARNLAGNIITGIKDKLLIRSPSRVMHELGEFTSQGFAQGINSGKVKVREAAEGTAKAFLDAFKDLQTERAVGKVDLSTYVRTLEQARDRLQAQLKTVKEGTPAYAEWLGALAKVTKELESVTAKSGGAQKAAKEAAEELAKNRAELEKGIAFDKWVDGLTSATRAQLLNAQATARAAGDAQKYNAIKAELERREAAATAATDKATEAAKRHAEQLASNQKAITDGLKFDTYVAGLVNYTDAQLNAAKANAYAAGDGQKFNAVLAEQKTRAEEAARAVSELSDAQINAANNRFKDTQGATDNAYRLTYGAGDEGLIKSLAAVTGLSVEKIRADVQGALDDAKRFAPEAAAVIERVWAEQLTHRRTVAAEEKAVMDEQLANARAYADELRRTLAAGLDSDAEARGLINPESLAAMQAELIALGRPLDSMVAWLEDVALGSDAAAVAAQEWLDKWNASLELLPRVGKTAEELGQDVQDSADQAAEAWDETNITLTSLYGQIDELREQGRDPMTSGFLDYLDGIIEKGGPAAAAAQQVKDSLEGGAAAAKTYADAVKAWDDNMAKLAWDDWVKGLEDFDDAQLDNAESTARLNLDVNRYNAVQAERVRRAKEAATADKDLADTQDASRKLITEATAELEKMITGEELPAWEKRAQALEAQAALDEANAEGLTQLAQRLREAGQAAEQLNVTVKIGGIDTGLKQMDLFKSAITGVADVISGAFENLVAGTASGTEDILRSMAKMALGIVKQVAVAIIAYQAQAIAMAIIKGATFDFVGAGLALAAAAAVAGIVAGLESRLGQSAGVRAAPSTGGLGTGSAAPAPSNSLVQIPASQVTIAATPEWMTTLTKAADTQLRAAELQLQAVREGLRVTVDNTGNGGGSPMTPLAILTP